MFKSIVVAIDGSEPAKRAVQAACELSLAFGSEVHLVHALEHKAAETPFQGSGDDGAAAGSSVVSEAAKLAESRRVVPSSMTVGEGDAYDEIITIAQLYDADLIVTGRRGLGNISGLFAGSTSQQIAKNAQCAYLSIK